MGMGQGRSYKVVGADAIGVWTACFLYNVLVLSGPTRVQFCVYNLHFTMGRYHSMDQIIPSSLGEVRIGWSFHLSWSGLIRSSFQMENCWQREHVHTLKPRTCSVNVLLRFSRTFWEPVVSNTVGCSGAYDPSARIACSAARTCFRAFSSDPLETNVLVGYLINGLEQHASLCYMLPL